MTSPESSTPWREDAPAWFGYAVFLSPLACYLLVSGIAPGVYERIYINSVATQSPSATLLFTGLKLAGVMAWIVWGWRAVSQVFPVRVSTSALVVGIVGGVLWIVLCRLQMEARLMTLLGMSAEWLGSRDSIDPWLLYEDAASRWVFLALRFSLLVIAVPIAEEWMLRGFLIRAVESDRWESFPLSEVGRAGFITASVYGMLSHPSEWIAAAVWFSLVTLLMIRTGRLWDCIVAHAITNAMLGVYVITQADWRLW